MSLGRWQATALAVSFVVGCGILFLPTLAVEIAGAVGALYAWIAMTVLVVPLIAVFSRLGSLHFKPEGITGYCIDGLGSWTRPAFQLSMLSALLFGMPAILWMTAQAFGTLLGLSQAWTPLWAHALLTVFCLNNLRPIRQSTKISLVSLACLLGTVAYVVFSRPQALLLGVHALATPVSALPPVHDLFKASLLIFFGYIGWESMSLCTRDLENPARDSSFVYWVSFGLISVIYLALAFAVSGSALQGIRPSPEGILRLVHGGPLTATLTLLVAFVIMANINAWILAGIRQLQNFAGTSRPIAPKAVAVYYLFITIALAALERGFADASGLILLSNQNWIVLYGGALLFFFRKAKTSYDYAIAVFAGISFLMLLPASSWGLALNAVYLLISAAVTLFLKAREPSQESRLHVPTPERSA